MARLKQTNPDIIGQLEPEQELAIASLIQGATDAEAAEAAGVTRQTVNAWRNHNPAFVAELNGRRQEVWTGNADRIRQLIGKALDVLAADLDANNVRLRQAAAVHVLRAAGLYGASLAPEGETNAEAVDMKRRIQEAELREADLLASLTQGRF